MVSTAPVQVQSDVPARMRDGVVLRADVYRPDGPGPFPVLLTRTPYGKTGMPMMVQANRALAAAGYIVVAQDVRGRFASEGDFRVYHDDIADGYDSVAWAAELDGSTGAAGMFGTSYMGYTQMMAAAAAPPRLKAIFPVQAAGDQWDGGVYCGGAFRLADWLGWSLGQAAQTADKLGRRIPDLDRITALTRERTAAMMAGDMAGVIRIREQINGLLAPHLNHLPLSTLPLFEGVAPHYFEQLARAAYDEYWHEADLDRLYGRMDVPCFSLGGWYDIRLKGDIDAYVQMRARSRRPETRAAQRIVIGPWTHGQFLAQAGEAAFSEDAAIDVLSLQRRWFDHWLKGIDTGLLEEPPVRIYVMGANRWRDEDDWPLPRTRYTPYYFHSGGRANTLHGDGLLSLEPPGEEPADSYLSDPTNPVPSVGGKSLGNGFLPGVFDQRAVEERPDVLCYTTPPLAHDVEVTGPLSVTLYAASSAPDTDRTAKLVDVHPDGSARNLQEGIIRASYRLGAMVAPSPITPDAIVEYTIDLWATSNVFQAGHRIRVEIASSNFPHWDRNPFTVRPAGTATRPTTAHQRIFHDAAHPSHIVLPVV
jgi:putative CocE/NonD family hydrolase